MKLSKLAWAAGPLALIATPALADAPAPKMDSGDTAWMLASTALVLMMTIPGLAMFYGGMVRRKTMLATMMQSFTVCCLVTIAWMVIGYSIAFTNGTPYFGDMSRFFLQGFGATWDKPFTLGAGVDGATQTTIPESVYMMFQMTFAIITPALITGAFADRMKFSALLIFMTLWSILVYAPIAHWVWSATGWLGAGVFGLPGAADFAGGTVVHINAGIAGLMCALVLGKRVGYGHDNMAPYNVSFALIGASLLWVGWFGFNAGSAVAANGRAGMAMTATQIATAAAALAWMFAEWAAKGKPSVLGVASGAVAGLVAITPASGFVLPGPALLIGIVAGVGCFWAATSLKHALGYDDSLDAFGVHGVGGIIGALLTGVFAFGPFTATAQAPQGVNIGGLPQFEAQVIAVVSTLVYSGVMTLIILMVTKALVGLRVDEEAEREGLDLVLHGEQIFQ
ncbi:MAG TPA: ammonium transporter [Acetobacteraceae bacterium]|nr:ammonium transporter [Acetobacteraceae bacterium]